jgi:hypothetical protein
MKRLHGQVMTAGYSIVEDEDGSSSPRISAVSASGEEIAGAYLPHGQANWRLYVTPLLASVAGVQFRQSHLHLFSREEASRWVDLIARLYVAAIPGQQRISNSNRRPVSMAKQPHGR